MTLSLAKAPAFPEFRSESLREAVVAYLRDAILDGAFQPGQALSESELSARMKISRGPVREALLLLMQAGLVCHSHNRGFSVLNMGFPDVAAITAVRLPLETLALHSARFRGMTAEGMRRLEELAAQMHEEFDSSRSRTTKADLEFHDIVWQAAGNDWLLLALRRTVVPFFAMKVMYGLRGRQLTAAIFDEQHKLYLDFLKNKGDLSAEECVRFHLKEYEDVVIAQHVKEQGMLSGKGVVWQ